jgi:hypothetical protein
MRSLPVIHPFAQWHSRTPNPRHLSRLTSIIRSTPLRYTSLVTHTMVRQFGCRADGFGVKDEVSTALGMTETLPGSTFARRTVFSLLVCDTQITWLMFVKVKSRTLFMCMADGSENPNSEWSVKIVLIPMTFACIRVSCPNTLNAWCPCTARGTMVRESECPYHHSAVKLPAFMLQIAWSSKARVFSLMNAASRCIFALRIRDFALVKSYL